MFSGLYASENIEFYYTKNYGKMMIDIYGHNTKSSPLLKAGSFYLITFPVKRGIIVL